MLLICDTEIAEKVYKKLNELITTKKSHRILYSFTDTELLIFRPEMV